MNSLGILSILLISCSTVTANSDVIDVRLCDTGEKGCLRRPEACSPASDCDVAIAWAISPDNQDSVRFEMMAKLTIESNPVEYIALAMSADTRFMDNSSVLVCGINIAGSSTTAYFSHNTLTLRSGSTPLAEDIRQEGLTEIDSSISSSHFSCTIDCKIRSAVAEQAGLVFPLDQLWYPAWAFGKNGGDNLLSHHTDKLGFDTKVNFSEQTLMSQSTLSPVSEISSPSQPYTTSLPLTTASTGPDIIDLEFCEKGEKGCIRQPTTCFPASKCDMAITWLISPDDKDSVRFEMAAKFKMNSRAIEYVALAMSDNTQFMDNSSVLVCGIDNAGTGTTTYFSQNSLTLRMGSYPLPENLRREGLSVIESSITSSHFLCTVDRKIVPALQEQVGSVFPLDQLWYPAWAVGANSDGTLSYHYENKGGYTDKVNFTEHGSSPGQPTKDTTLLRQLHGVFMMAGWMICVACSIITPRYLRCHWITSKFCGLQLWFVVHRTLMLMGVVFVIVGLVLILVANNFLLVDLGSVYPDALHPYFGIVAIIILFANPIVALFRCKPTDDKRVIFNWIHGSLGLLGFMFAAANLIFGGMMMNKYAGSLAMYPIIAWVAIHALVESVFLGITFCCKSSKSKRQNKELLYYISSSLFVGYFLVTVALTVAASAMLF